MKEAKAGAGLPFYERYFIKYLAVPFVRVFLSWDSSLKLLEKESKKIQLLIKDIKSDKLEKKVKINRVFGIEEHSCNYSINMTLEHLVIVTNAMIFVIDTLSKEQTIKENIKIENVKPKNTLKNEALEFFSSIEKYTLFIKNHPKNISKTTKAHPWFIEFNNKDWSIFTYIHTLVHRRQIEAIIKKLDSAKI